MNFRGLDRMDDYSDDDMDHYETRRRKEELEESLFAMKNMLRQLNEAQEGVQSPPNYPYAQGRTRRPQGRRGWGRGREGPRGRGGRGGGAIDGYNFSSPVAHSGSGRPMQPYFQGTFENFGSQWNMEGRGFQGSDRDPDMSWNSRKGFSPSRGAVDRREFSGERYRNPGYMAQKVNVYQSEHENFHEQKPTRQTQAYGLRPQFLAETLANAPNFSCSLLQLLEQRNMQPTAVRDVAHKHPHIFKLNAEDIALRPNIRLCHGHNNHEGCHNPDSCGGLHICERYVLDSCFERGCIFGHRWRTGHNDLLLRPLLIERLPFPTLRSLVQFVQGPVSGSTDLLNVCNAYNNKEGCNLKNCPSLHICHSFVTELTNCKISDCPLNHDLLTTGCLSLFQKHGIATNETPRDILIALHNLNPSLKIQKQTSIKQQKQESPNTGKAEENTVRKHKAKNSSKEAKFENGKKHKRKGSRELSSSELGSSNEDSVSDSDDEDKKTKGIPSKTNPQKVTEETLEGPNKANPKKPPVSVKPASLKTIWSHYLQGETPVPEICYYSVESSCKNEGSACQRLHATKHFHWQVKDQGSIWLNLRPDQVTCLEYAYCDPDECNVDLPRLDPATLEYSVSGLFIIMGREIWQADFNKMVISNNSKTKILDIRRLCTEPISGLEIKPASYLWYFLDKNNKWIKYGDVDTAGASRLVSSVASNDIEKQYLLDPKSSLSFKNSQFSYVLDFKTMTQMNLSTRATRKVVRRPQPHLQDQEREEKSKRGIIDLPETWHKMQPEVRVILVTLAPSSIEYTAAVTLLSGRISPSKVLKVQRVQNPYLWRAFQNKVKEMTAVYKDVSKVNICQLFHGTPSDVVDNICSENFDWRLHGTKSGQSYGRGSYFAVDANYSYKYATPDSNNIRYMFIARVAVGTVIHGNSQMIRPPMNPHTKVLYDSTVDHVSSPSIIVKYDKQEYYPEYLLTLS